MVKEINICMSSDETFAELCTVTMVSALLNANPEHHYNFWVFDNAITTESKEKMKASIEQYNASINFICSVDLASELQIDIDTGRWTMSCMQRLFVCRFLPADIERVLYLDGDMLVCSDLAEIYFLDFENCYLGGAVQDCVSPLNRRNIGLEDNDYYFNSGMFMINIKGWREQSVEDKFISELIKFEGKLQYPDQDLLNLVLRDKIKVINPRYNVMTHVLSLSYEDLMYYHAASNYISKKEYYEAREKPGIVHYTVDSVMNRPWYEHSNHVYRNQWLEVREKTLWKEKELWKEKLFSGRKIKMLVFGLLPRKIGLIGARYIHLKHVKNYSK